MTTPERRHVIVAHQERYQLRKQIRLLKKHNKGLHKDNPILTCNGCTPVTPIEEGVPTKNV